MFKWFGMLADCLVRLAVGRQRHMLRPGRRICWELSAKLVLVDGYAEVLSLWEGPGRKCFPPKGGGLSGTRKMLMRGRPCVRLRFEHSLDVFGSFRRQEHPGGKRLPTCLREGSQLLGLLGPHSQSTTTLLS